MVRSNREKTERRRSGRPDRSRDSARGRGDGERGVRPRIRSHLRFYRIDAAERVDAAQKESARRALRGEYEKSVARRIRGDREVRSRGGRRVVDRNRLLGLERAVGGD